MHGDLSLAVSGCKHYASTVFLQCNQFSMECKLRANCWSDKQRAMYLVLDTCEGLTVTEAGSMPNCARIENRTMRSTSLKTAINR